MRLIIISGLSGSGKSTALHVLEDLGYFCIDNLPIGLLSSFTAHILGTPEEFYHFAAVGVDARNRPEELHRFPEILRDLRNLGIDCQVLFLDADNNILLKRFNETRRKHPLTNDKVSLAEAITNEHRLLDPISTEANLYIDTSHTNLYQLRDIIRQRVESRNRNKLSILFQSFGYKHGLPKDADIAFDVRCLPNPYWETHLREHTGLDQPVIEYLQQQPLVEEMFEDIKNYLTTWIPRIQASDRQYLTVAIGCTGGQHRSVFMVERLANHFKDLGDVIARHRELA